MGKAKERLLIVHPSLTNRRSPPRVVERRRVQRRHLAAPRDADTGLAFPKRPHSAVPAALSGPYAKHPNPHDANPYLQQLHLQDLEQESLRVQPPARETSLRKTPGLSAAVGSGEFGCTSPTSLFLRSPCSGPTGTPGSLRPVLSAGSLTPEPPMLHLPPERPSRPQTGGGARPCSVGVMLQQQPTPPPWRQQPQQPQPPAAAPLSPRGERAAPPPRPFIAEEWDSASASPRELLALVTDCAEPPHRRRFASAVRTRKAESESGFAELTKSLARLMPRLQSEGGSLSEKWRDVSHWIDRFHVDRDADRLVEHCESLLTRAYSAAAGQKHPNPAMTRVSLVLMEQLFRTLDRALPRLRDVSAAVRGEVLSAVLVSGPPEAEAAPDLAGARSVREAAERARQGEKLYSGKTFYAVVREIAHRIGRAEEEIMREEEIRNKQMAVMDRAIGFWQMEYQKLVLKAWRAVRVRERTIEERDLELQNMERRIADVRHELNVALKEFDDQKEQMAEEMAELEAQLAARDAAVAEAQSALEEAQEARDKAIRRENETQYNLYKKQEEARQAGVEVKALDRVLDYAVHKFLEGPTWEMQRQDQHAHFFRDPQAMGRATWLVSWYNAAITACAATLPAAANIRLQSFGELPSVLNAHIVVMHHIAPALVASGAITTGGGADEANLRPKASEVLRAAESVGLSIQLTPGMLVHPPLHSLHNLRLAAALFERFADSGLAAARGMDSLALECQVSPHRGPAKVQTSDYWQARVTEAGERLGRLRCAAAAAQALVANAALGRLTGAEDPQELSEPQLVERDGDCVDPAARVFLNPPHRAGSPRVDSWHTDGLSPAQECEGVVEVLTANYRSIRRVFEQLSQGRAVAPAEACVKAFLELRLPARTFTKGKTAELLSDLVSDGTGRRRSTHSPRRPSKSRPASPAAEDRGLALPGFTQFILRVSEERGRISKDGRTAAQRLNQFLQHHLIPLARWTAPSVFRQVMFLQDMQEVLSVHNTFACRVFSLYVERDKKVREDDLMRVEILLEMLGDAQALEGPLTKDAVRETVASLHDPGCTDLSYMQFVETLCALAALRTPGPLVPLCAKVARFFELWLIPNLSVRLHGFPEEPRQDFVESLCLHSQVPVQLADDEDEELARDATAESA